jgi:formimidoylglutamate deiminase
METLILEPEFYIDFKGRITKGPLAITGTMAHDISLVKMPAKTLRLPNQVVMPGFVNVHSHSFQRLLRGSVEQKGRHHKDNFWSWREQMYRLAQTLSKDDLAIITQLVYLEMLEAGFTHVGEFHYLHHHPSGKPYPDPLHLSKAIVSAANATGINLCLLECAYERHNFSEPLKKEQRRFAHHSAQDFLDFLKQAQTLTAESITVGAAIHSVRAVAKDWFSTIHEYTHNHHMPLHIHVSEQQSEVDACLSHTHYSPIALLNQYGLLTPKTTLIHATHLIRGDIDLLAKKRPLICICPSTEKNLGDGMVPIADLFHYPVRICLGTDQHVRLDPFSEARNLEEQERLRLQKRLILPQNDEHLYEALLPCLQSAGMSSLYPTFDDSSLFGLPANLIAIELPPEYLWHGPEVALNAMMLAHHPHKITTVITNGQMVVESGQGVHQNKSLLVKEISKIVKK